MRSKKIKALLLAAGCVLALSGCTKSNIVRPEESSYGPDFNLYNNIQIDVDQLHDDVDDVYLDPDDYPMASAIDFELDPNDEYIDITVVVKDGTSSEDASWYVGEAIKGVNDQIAMQDFNYGESDEDTFGGYYQDREINLKVYEESAYEADGDPIYETTIPKDEFMVFDIQTSAEE